MTTNPGSEPAFPIRERTEHSDGAIVCEEWSGMTMRQYYKAVALQGLLASKELKTSAMYRMDKEWTASEAGDYADAMISEDTAHAEKHRND